MNVPHAHAPIGGMNDADVDRIYSSTNQREVPIPLPGPKLPCGGVAHGTCRMGKCVCRAGHTGPLCLAYIAHNDIDYDAMTEEPLVVQVPRVTHSVTLLVLGGGFVLCLLIYTRMQHIRSMRENHSAAPNPALLRQEYGQSGSYMSVSTEDSSFSHAAAAAAAAAAAEEEEDSPGWQRRCGELALVDLPPGSALPLPQPAGMEAENTSTSYQQQC